MAKDGESPGTAELDPAASDVPPASARGGAKKRRDPSEPAAVVGIGASAGGVSVLQQFFADMKPDTGLAFVVVMHLSPDHESQLANVIQQKTSMPVAQVNEPVKVRPNHVYVIPPTHQLAFEDGVLRLVEPPDQMGRRVAIDLFFRTLAHAFGQRAVCIIMSGSDSDGVIGFKHIRAQGGVTIAQDPNEAEYDSMPVTAISTGMVDWVLPVAAMPAKLVEFAANERRMRLPPEIPDAEEPDLKVADAPGGETVSNETRDPQDEEAIGHALAYVRAQTSHDFSHYKRATVLRRIARRLQVNSIETIPAYLEFLRTHPVEVRALLHDLLIGVTHFFRDRESFAALESHIPQLFAGKAQDDEIRVWVPGCSTGEEAYSIAILLTEHAQRLDNPPKFQVFATDLDDESIADARQGMYPATIEADVSPGRLREFFLRDHGRYRVRKEIRENVLFAMHNLLMDAPFSHCDLVSCRNLLIYLKTEAQKHAFDIFHFSLGSGGLLFLGSAENHGAGQSLFSPVDVKHRIYVRRSTPRPSWRTPNLPVRPPPVRRRPGSGHTPRRLPALTQNIADETADASVESRQAGQSRRDALFGELHLRLLEEYGPPSVVINDGYDIVHLSESAGRYLHFAAGEPTANLPRVVLPALQIEARTTLFKASQTKQSVRSAPVPLDLETGPEKVVLHVRPIEAGDNAHGFFLVLFESQDGTAAGPTPRVAPATVEDADAADEIQFLKEQLAATSEQHEARNEELKASNEELQAMNEEMRSATEELETSKEELQSVNEELVTVNAELKSSVEDLSRTNTDLNNLMASTDIGTIFLDRQLRIQRFTPSAQKIFNLIGSDLGRPISDITSSLNYEGFLDDVREVLDDLHTIEREMPVEGDGAWYLMRLAPYRTEEDRIAGVVVTFVDISRRKFAEDAIAESERFVRSTLDSFASMIAILDPAGTIVDVNEAWKKFARENNYAQPQFGIGENYLEVTRRAGGMEAKSASEGIGAVLKGTKAFFEFEYPCHSPDAFRWFIVSVSPLGTARGGAVVWHTDITARKQAEQLLRDTNEQFRVLADNVPQLIWTNNPEGKANYFNKRWFEYSGLSVEDSFGSGWEAIVHPDDAAASVKRWQRALEKGEVFDAEYRLRGADGQYRWFIGRNVPLRDEDNRVTGWFGTATDIHDLKMAQADMRATEERFRLLVEGARDYAMFLLDRDNVITFWSSGAERVFGWSETEAIGQSGAMIFTPEDRARGEVEKEINTALAEGRALDRRFHLRKDGSKLWTDGVLMRIDEQDGRLRGFAKVARDATDQRRTEDELAHARDELEQRVLERTREVVAMNTELEQTMAQRQQLERELLEISEREKRRIGEDLHDMICQELTATALFLKSSAKKVGPKSAAAQVLEESAETVNRNVVIARELAGGLQAIELSASGLKNALRDLAAHACQNSGLRCHFRAARGVRVPDDAVALHLYRVAQEAVNNAVKHSGAKNIMISLDRNAENICVSVQDDGKGFVPRRRGKGLGLHMMRYRANALGGELKVTRRRTGGTEITCVIPIKR